jgi:hypothetical protein
MSEGNGGSAAPAGAAWALADERLFVLSNPYELDGRITHYPRDTRGYAPMQCYLLKEGDHALLMGSGWSTQQERILDQLSTLLGSAQLSFIPAGLDLSRLCNVRPISDRFGLAYCYYPPVFDDPAYRMGIRPEFPQDESDSLRATTATPVPTGKPFNIDPAGTRALEVLVPALRLLPGQWLYDGATKTLFPVDVFTWVTRPDAAGPWVVTEDDDDPTTVETVRHRLFDNRYWWLPGANTAKIRERLADLFERYEIENIAPENGCVLKGSKVVGRHYRFLDDVLASAPQEPPHGVAVGQWTFASAFAGAR